MWRDQDVADGQVLRSLRVVHHSSKPHTVPNAVALQNVHHLVLQLAVPNDRELNVGTSGDNVFDTGCERKDSMPLPENADKADKVALPRELLATDSALQPAVKPGRVHTIGIDNNLM